MWQVLSRKQPSHSKATTCAIAAFVFLLLISVLTAFYVTGVLKIDSVEDRLQKLSKEFICSHEEICDTDTEESKSPRGLRLRKTSGLSVRCSQKKEILQWTKSVVHKKLENERRQVERDASEHEYRYLKTTKEAVLDPNRIIIHWFPRVVSTVTGNSIWTPISNYEHSGSTYTVSPGPKGSYRNGSFVVPESGVYYVYAKVTFACKTADFKQKRLEIQVTLTSLFDESTLVLMEDMENGTCGVEGDLSTVTSNGLFRLEKGSQITVRHKASKNVHISSGPNSAFKSAIGLYRIGLH